jgi:hypothetical protein
MGWFSPVCCNVLASMRLRVNKPLIKSVLNGDPNILKDHSSKNASDKCGIRSESFRIITRTSTFLPALQNSETSIRGMGCSLVFITKDLAFKMTQYLSAIVKPFSQPGYLVGS